MPERKLYVSPTMVPHLRRPKNITLDALPDKEQVVLSVIEDGSDDQQASQRLAMAKLKLHHKGQLMLYALQNGYIWVTAQRIHYPGFQRSLQATAVLAKVAPTERASA